MELDPRTAQVGRRRPGTRLAPLQTDAYPVRSLATSASSPALSQFSTGAPPQNVAYRIAPQQPSSRTAAPSSSSTNSLFARARGPMAQFDHLDNSPEPEVFPSVFPSQSQQRHGPMNNFNHLDQRPSQPMQKKRVQLPPVLASSIASSNTSQTSTFPRNLAASPPHRAASNRQVSSPTKMTSPPKTVEKRQSRMSLLNLFSKPKVERARGYTETNLAVAAPSASPTDPITLPVDSFLAPEYPNMPSKAHAMLVGNSPRSSRQSNEMQNRPHSRKNSLQNQPPPLEEEEQQQSQSQSQSQPQQPPPSPPKVHPSTATTFDNNVPATITASATSTTTSTPTPSAPAMASAPASDPLAFHEAFSHAIKTGRLQAPTFPPDGAVKTSRQGKRASLLNAMRDSKLDVTMVEDSDGPHSQNASDKASRRFSSMSNSAFFQNKVFVLTKAAAILQYAAEGSPHRRPEAILPLSKQSVAFASDAIPGRHWVLQISQAGTNTTETIPEDPPAQRRGFIGRLRSQNNSIRRKTTTNFYLVLESPQDMSDWMFAVRKVIESMGGQKSQPDAHLERRQDEIATERGLPVKHSRARNISLSRRDVQHVPVLSPIDSPGLPADTTRTPFFLDPTKNEAELREEVARMVLQPPRSTPTSRASSRQPSNSDDYRIQRSLSELRRTSRTSNSRGSTQESITATEEPVARESSAAADANMPLASTPEDTVAPVALANSPPRPNIGKRRSVQAIKPAPETTPAPTLAPASIAAEKPTNAVEHHSPPKPRYSLVPTITPEPDAASLLRPRPGARVHQHSSSAITGTRSSSMASSHRRTASASTQRSTSDAEAPPHEAAPPPSTEEPAAAPKSSLRPLSLAQSLVKRADSAIDPHMQQQPATRVLKSAEPNKRRYSSMPLRIPVRPSYPHANPETPVMGVARPGPQRASTSTLDTSSLPSTSHESLHSFSSSPPDLSHSPAATPPTPTGGGTFNSQHAPVQSTTAKALRRPNSLQVRTNTAPFLSGTRYGSLSNHRTAGSISTAIPAPSAPPSIPLPALPPAPTAALPIALASAPTSAPTSALAPSTTGLPATRSSAEAPRSNSASPAPTTTATANEDSTNVSPSKAVEKPLRAAGTRLSAIGQPLPPRVSSRYFPKEFVVVDTPTQKWEPGQTAFDISPDTATPVAGLGVSNVNVGLSLRSRHALTPAQSVPNLMTATHRGTSRRISGMTHLPPPVGAPPMRALPPVPQM